MSSPDRQENTDYLVVMPQKRAIAEALFREYINNPDGIIETAQQAMIATDNDGLRRIIHALLEDYEQYHGEDAAQRFHQGLSFAFSYYQNVAAIVTHTPLPVITKETIDQVGKHGLHSQMQKHYDEFFFKEEYGQIQAQKIRDEYTAIDTPLLWVTLAIIEGNPNMQPFLGGVNVMDYIFRRPATESATAAD